MAVQARAGRRDRVRIAILAAAMVVLPAGRAGVASWKFESGAAARLDYGDLPVVTIGKSGAFSTFCAVKLDDPLAGDAFLLGKLTGGAQGWQVLFDLDVDGTGHENRFRFWVSSGDGQETERYAVAPAVAGRWYSVGGSYTWDESAAAGAAEMSIFVDGVPDAEVPRFDTGRRPGGHADALTIGAPATGDAAGATHRVGHAAVWDGYALTAEEHEQLAAGADPRTVAPAHLVFYASLEDDDAEDLVGGTVPLIRDDATFSVDRRRDFKPLVMGQGDVTPTSIRILSHVGRAGAHRIEYTAYDFPGTRTEPKAAFAENDWVVGTMLSGLAADRTYRFRLHVDDVVIPSSESEFRTAPASECSVFSFVYGSCSQLQYHEPPFFRFPMNAFDAIADRGPAFLVHSGDVWYSDRGGHDENEFFDAWDMNTVEGFARKARESLGEKHLARTFRELPAYTMPDDHEWTNNISGVDGLTGEDRERYEKALRRIVNWQFPRNPSRFPKAEEDGGLWYSFSYGGVDFFFLNVRTQRSPNAWPNEENKKMRGPDDRQRQDLLDWLEASTAAFKVILSPGMISRFGVTGRDGWGTVDGFSQDAERVLARIDDYDDVVFLSGDVHWSGAIRLVAHPYGDPAHDLYEFVGCPYGGPVSPPVESGDEDLLFTYNGRPHDPDRSSHLVVTVDTTRTPATPAVEIVSHDPGDGRLETVYVHPPIRSRRTCPGDVDADGRVDFADLLGTLAAWGPCPPGRCRADFDGSGAVGTGDLLVVLAAWGPCSK